MPMINLTTSAAIDAPAAEKLKAGLGRAIPLLPGKSESLLMISLRGNTPMYFHGEALDLAFVEVNCFGHLPSAAYEKLTGAVTELLGDVLAIKPENVFIKYFETDNWGWNGRNL